MPAEPLTLSTVPPASSVDTDYEAICAAVTATARGRWFLDEFARRNRNSDTLQVLDAIARMEAAVVGERAHRADRQASQEVRIELLEMARAIARVRAEAAESRSGPSQELAAEPADATGGPDVTGAAERLRQIAWTMRACGVEIAASDQIGQIADAILSADALRNLGDQRAHKLTEALHHLEHRIDRMLDGHLSAAIADAERLAAETPRATSPDRETAPDAAAVAAAMFAAAAALEAETEPAHSPANDDTPPAAAWQEAAATPVLEEPVEVRAPEDAAQIPVAEEAAPVPLPAESAQVPAPQEAVQVPLPEETAQAPAPQEAVQVPLPEETAQAPKPQEAVQVPLPEETAQAPASEEAAPGTAADLTEYPMDEDVVLTVADGVIDMQQRPLPSIELEPAFVIPSAREPTPLPSMDLEPTSFVASVPEPTPLAESIEAQPESNADHLQALEIERAELEVEPLVVAASEDDIEIPFSGLELEPLVATPAIAAKTQAATAPEQAHAVAQEQKPNEPVLATAFIINDVLNQLHVDAPPAGSAAAESVPEMDIGAVADRPLTRATGASVTALPDSPNTVAAVEPIATAEPRAAQPADATVADPIAMQVDYDLADLTDTTPEGGDSTRAVAPSQPLSGLIPANALNEDDPADFLLEALPGATLPGDALRRDGPAPAASAQASDALFANALAAIETELRTGATQATARANAPESPAAPRPPVAAAAVTTTPSVTDGRLAALMALSEEERIALFS